jgi:hypothetical protein
LNVYDIFESINSKKLELAISDLTKNIILKKCVYETQNQYDLAINKVNHLAKFFEDSPKQMSDFLKHYWSAREKIPRDDFYELYKTSDFFKNNSAEVILDSFLNYAEHYKKIISPIDSDWKQSSSYRKIFSSLQEIKFFGFRTSYPIIMQILVSYPKKMGEVSEVINKIVCLSFFQTVLLNDRPGKLEREYADLSQKLCSGKIDLKTVRKSLEKHILALKPYIEDKLRSPLIGLQSKEIKFILYRVYKYRRKERNPLASVNINNLADTSLEHVLPESPENWRDDILFDLSKSSKRLIKFHITDFDDYCKRYTILLGNLSLMSKRDNSSTANKPFAIKKVDYQRYENDNPLFKDILKYNAWDSKKIEIRNTKLISDFIKGF